MVARTGSSYCWSHDPEHAEDRRRNASKAGSTKTSTHGRIRELDQALSKLADDVLKGRIDKSVGAVVTLYRELALQAVG
jgi:hypothetical protein